MGQKKKLNRILGVVAPESVRLWLCVCVCVSQRAVGAKWFSVVPAGSLNHVRADRVGVMTQQNITSLV